MLVTTPPSAFGGDKGGDTSQNRREEQELAAFKDQKVKDETEQRHRKLKRRISSCDSPNDPMLRIDVNVDELDNKRSHNGSSNIRQPLPFAVPFNNNEANNSVDLSSSNTLLSDSQMMLSVLGSPDPLMPSGVGYTSESMQERNNMARFANLPGEINRFNQVGRVRERDSESPTGLTECGVQRPLSPSLLMINEHHHSPHVDLSSHDSHSPDRTSHLTLSGTGQGVQQMEIVIAPTTLGGNSTSPHINQSVTSTDVVDFEGRSSASNSDFDSESDDVSFDDSASDRSVGSDSGSDSGSGYFSEPFIAARVMALNRMHQQHRREQYLQDRASRQLAAPSSNFQPPPDPEYQSGDSVDSTLAEDSCGSDSSSSDFAD